MAQQHLGHRAQISLGIGRTRRVRRRVQDQPFGTRRDRRVEVLGTQFETVVLRTGHRNRGAVAQQYHFRVGDPERRRDRDLVAGVDRGDQRVVQHLLAAGADGDLRGLVIEPVLALEFVADRALQLDPPVEHGVARLAAPHRRDRRLLDVRRRIEIGLPDRQADDIAPGRLQLGGKRGDRHGRRGFDAGETIGEKGHDGPL